MSEPDSNSAASLTPSPSITTATRTQSIVLNTVRVPRSQPPSVPPPSQPPPVPPPSRQPPYIPPPYRTMAPIHYPYPYQQPYNYLFTLPNQNRHPNPTPPPPVLYPYPPTNPGRGFSTRPVRANSPSVAAHHLLPSSPVNVAMNQMASMMQQLRRNPQIYYQAPRVGSGSPLRPRGGGRARKQVVLPPTASVRDTNRSNNTRSQEGSALVHVQGRKVRISEGATLNSLCRSWLGNGVTMGGIQMIPRRDTIKPLPKPLPVMEANVPAEEPTDEEDKEDDNDSVKDLSEKDLLKQHIERAKKVRARLKQERLSKIKRYRERLRLILPKPEEEDQGGEEGK